MVGSRPCPQCNAVLADEYRYCEKCGYDNRLRHWTVAHTGLPPGWVIILVLAAALMLAVWIEDAIRDWPTAVNGRP